MRTRKSKQLFNVVVEFETGVTKTVKIRATTMEIAEKRALKFNPSAKGVKHNGR